MPIFINLHKDKSGPHLGDGETHASLEEARQYASLHDGYLCTLELTDDGVPVRRHSGQDAIEMIRCERRFDNLEIEDCECGKHVVLPAEPDVGIFQPYLEG